jgi:hypothetical protein
MSKLGFYGKTEATPAMRQEARRRARAQAASGTQQYAASEQNLGSMLSVGTLGIPAEAARPFSELGKRALGKAASASPSPGQRYGKRQAGQATVAQAGKFFLEGRRRRQKSSLLVRAVRSRRTPVV